MNLTYHGSINYHHDGASKTWYGVPGHAAYAFENVVREHVYDGEILIHEGVDATFNLLIGKTTMFPQRYYLNTKFLFIKLCKSLGNS